MNSVRRLEGAWVGDGPCGDGVRDTGAKFAWLASELALGAKLSVGVTVEMLSGSGV